MEMTGNVLEALFREAVATIDAGDLAALERMLAAHPELAQERLTTPGAWLRDQVGDALDGFFHQPYLLWFVAEDPVRTGRLPPNIAEVARAIVAAARRAGADSLQEQLDHALRLVSWSWIARECGVQIQLIDVLADAGAALDGNPNNALVNRNIAAARHLVERGAPLTLAAAVCLNLWEEAAVLATSANTGQKQFAFVLAALTGNAAAVARMLEVGVDVNAPSDALYSHATPLHHAVCSGSLAAVSTIVEAGADLGIKDTAWGGTPLGWAEHYRNEKKLPEEVARYAAIADYLRKANSHL